MDAKVGGSACVSMLRCCFICSVSVSLSLTHTRTHSENEHRLRYSFSKCRTKYVAFYMNFSLPEHFITLLVLVLRRSLLFSWLAVGGLVTLFWSWLTHSHSIPSRNLEWPQTSFTLFVGASFELNTTICSIFMFMWLLFPCTFLLFDHSERWCLLCVVCIAYFTTVHLYKDFAGFVVVKCTEKGEQKIWPALVHLCARKKNNNNNNMGFFPFFHILFSKGTARISMVTLTIYSFFSWAPFFSFVFFSLSVSLFICVHVLWEAGRQKTKSYTTIECYRNRENGTENAREKWKWKWNIERAVPMK